MEANTRAVNQFLLRSCDPTGGVPPEKKAGCFDPAKSLNLKITYQIAFRPVKENTGPSGVKPAPDYAP
jgi:hypothetical protein